VLLRELFVVQPKRPILLEGGNVWPDTVPFDQAIAHLLANETNRYLSGVGGHAYIIGSSATPTKGKMTGDLDVMVDLGILMHKFGTKDGKTTRVELEKFLQSQGLETKKTGTQVHIKLPFKNNFHQVDIKVVAHAAHVHKLHIHDIPAGSPYKGVHKQVILSTLASKLGMLYGADEGLYARDPAGKKAQFITYDLDEIAKKLLGNGATAKNIGSVEAIMNSIKDPALKAEILQRASEGSSWQSSPPIQLKEDSKPTVGRKYQHIEDLVFTNGSNGGLHAVERLRHMGTTNNGGIEIKWDGSPVIYWGRDEQGQFHMIPKNAWDYLKRGVQQTKTGASTMMNSPDDVTNFVLGTGDATKHDKQRIAFAHGLGQLWSYFESISPESGYIEGGILFSPSQPAKLNKASGEYEFQPNITKFHIPANSELGQRIGQAKLMVAATGYYDRIGGNEGRYPNAEKLSTSEVIVQGTTYVEQAPGIDEAGLKKVSAYITKHAANIDSFVAGQPGLSKPGDILYKFFNQHLRVAGVKANFADWVKTNISAGQAQKVLSHPGLDAVLTAVEMISNEKMKLIGKLSKGTHGGIRQTKPEGYVQAHPGTGFANDLPGQFVKTIDQANWAPRKD
jgi:Family of unknown function (DUF6267)